MAKCNQLTPLPFKGLNYVAVYKGLSDSRSPSTATVFTTLKTVTTLRKWNVKIATDRK